ncbi:FMN-binding protein [Bacillus sp. EB600]|uniref:FMN-binding protein n=1 Tax=Bacillus sp. EB600 TaxID=2806345 RepID=UPI00210B9BD5|nr:FMN-binding protein [Bacillus sp. EB600]MCQ6282104.1 FMN-binding protein [Bacillus sp. EB600]
MAKMGKQWVLLCSAAVAAVYATGYFSTEAQAVKLESQQAQISIQAKTNQSSVSLANNNQTNQTNQTNQIKQLYKNGTFTGSGMNRRGSIEVAVTLKNDKIMDVQISNWGMHYSESDVVGLPDEVLQKQNAQVNNVSGATYSTQAFEDAVQAALSQAQNA